MDHQNNCKTRCILQICRTSCRKPSRGVGLDGSKEWIHGDGKDAENQLVRWWRKRHI